MSFTMESELARLLSHIDRIDARRFLTNPEPPTGFGELPNAHLPPLLQQIVNAHLAPLSPEGQQERDDKIRENARRECIEEQRERGGQHEPY